MQGRCFSVRRHFINKKTLLPKLGTKALLLLCHPGIYTISPSFHVQLHTCSLCNGRRSRQLLLGAASLTRFPFVCPHKSIQSGLRCRIPPSAALFEFRSEPTTLNHRFKVLLNYYDAIIFMIAAFVKHFFQIALCGTSLRYRLSLFVKTARVNDSIGLFSRLFATGLSLSQSEI